MPGQTDLNSLIQHLTPVRQPGDYVFASVTDVSKIDRQDTLCEFKESEGTTIVIERSKADALQLSYTYVAAWITLEVHSSLAAVGLTAAFATELAGHGISCNVVAGYYHDHIFVERADAERAVQALRLLSVNAKKAVRS